MTSVQSQFYQQHFEVASSTFLEHAHASRAAHAVLDCLRQDVEKYAAFEDRNALVRQLGADVETCLGVPARLMFATSGVLHDQLQELLDAFLDASDYKDDDA